MKKFEDTPRRLTHFTPLRYPGGKGKLAAFVKEIIRSNKLFDGEYVEPYAGGAAIALELLLQEFVSRIHINDLSHPIYSFWKSVLDHTDELCRLIKDVPVSVESWDKQKKIFSNYRDYSYIQLGFATFFLNRTNRSGILNAGIIGGRDQSGPWKIDARYNVQELIFRIESIARIRNRINLTQNDALNLLREGVSRWDQKTLIYLDPPYFEQGRQLYYDYYKQEDHSALAEFIDTKMRDLSWLVSYDNVAPIKTIYSGFRSIVYDVGYSAREARIGKEVMFFSPNMSIPEVAGPIRQVGSVSEAA